MNDTQEYILQKSIDNLIKMLDKLNKDLETVSKEADYYHTMYLKYKKMHQDLLFHETGAKDPKPKDPTGLQNLLIYEAGVEDGKVSARQEDKSQSTMTKVYVLMGRQRGAWQPEILWMGIFLSMEAAEKQMQEYKKEGLNVAGMHIEEHEVEQ
jgi:hypothetical protein